MKFTFGMTDFKATSCDDQTELTAVPTSHTSSVIYKSTGGRLGTLVVADTHLLT